MTRRLEAGPLLVTLGALLLLVSVFLPWYSDEITAWEAFEVWDIVLFVLAPAALAVAIGLTTQDVDLVDRRFLPAAVAAVAVIVASQIIDPPPAAAGQDPDTGAWLALGAAVVMCLGALLTFGRLRVALTVEGRDQRRRVSAVDARGPQEPTTDEPAAARLFARERTAPEPASEEEAPVKSRRQGGNAATEPKQD